MEGLGLLLADGLRLGLTEGLGLTDALGLTEVEELGDTLGEGLGLPLADGLREGESEADGLSELAPVPAGDSASSRKRHANFHVSSVSLAISRLSASRRQNFSSDTERRLVSEGTSASNCRVSLVVPEKPITRRNPSELLV